MIRRFFARFRKFGRYNYAFRVRLEEAQRLFGRREVGFVLIGSGGFLATSILINLALVDAVFHGRMLSALRCEAEDICTSAIFVVYGFAAHYTNKGFNWIFPESNSGGFKERTRLEFEAEQRRMKCPSLEKSL